jgi:hypothetical protein
MFIHLHQPEMLLKLPGNCKMNILNIFKNKYDRVSRKLLKNIYSYYNLFYLLAPLWLIDAQSSETLL